MKTSIAVIILICFLSFKSSSCNDLTFIKIGTHTGRDSNGLTYSKSFYVPRYFRAVWQVAFTICRSFDMEMATLDTLAEYEDVKQMLTSLQAPMPTWIHLGGVTRSQRSTTDWYWVHSEEKVSYAMDWFPGEPGFHSSRQYCLAIQSGSSGQFADIDCHTNHGDEAFMCQKIDSIHY